MFSDSAVGRLSDLKFQDGEYFLKRLLKISKKTFEMS